MHGQFSGAVAGAGFETSINIFILKPTCWGLVKASLSLFENMAAEVSLHILLYYVLIVNI